MSSDPQLFERFGTSVAAGTVIFREGDDGDRMYIIQSGRVRIVKRFGGGDHTLAVLATGDFFGEMAIVNRVQRTATAIATSTCDLLAVDRQGFLAMIKKNAEIALNIIDKLCRRLQSNHQQMQHLMRRNGPGLIAMQLHYALQSSADSVVPLEQTVEDISLSLEVPRDDVAGHLDRYVEQGIIAIESGTDGDGDAARILRLVDEGGLQRLAAVQS